MNIKNKILLFLIIILSIKLVQGSIIEEIVFENRISKKYASKTTCEFKYKVLCVEESPEDDCDNLEFNEPQYVKLGNKISNGTATVIDITLNTPIGNYSNTINSTFTFKSECLELDLNSISFKPFGDAYYKPLLDFNCNMYLRLYKMEGDFDPQASLENISFYSTYYFYNIPGTNFFELRVVILQMAPLSPISVQITSNNKVKDFVLEPIGKGIFDKVYDIKTYPDVKYLNSLETFGYNEGAVIEFKLNNSVYSSLFEINVNDQFYYTQFKPIYGDEHSTTFLYAPSTYDAMTHYSIYYINNGEVKKSGYSIDAKMNSYKIQNLPSTGEFNGYKGGLMTIAYGFNDIQLYDFGPIIVDLDGEKIETRFPFGYSSTANGYRFYINSIVKSGYLSLQFGYVSLKSRVFPQVNYLSYNFNEIGNINGPKILDFEIIHLEKEMYLLRLEISAQNSLYYIKDNTNKRNYYGVEALVSGDLNQGIYEIILDVSLSHLEIYDEFKNVEILEADKVISTTKGLKPFINPYEIENFNFQSIKQVSFLYNDIDISNHRHHNVLYFNSSEIPKDRSVGLIIRDATILSNPVYTSTTNVNIFYSRFNEDLKLFELEFYVECNTQLNEFNFDLYISTMVITYQALDTKLKIKKSNLDLQGPMFKDIKKISPITIDKNNNIGQIGWSISIEDPINGFESGYVTIRGEVDQSIYNITFTAKDVKAGGDEFLGEYDFIIKISYPCISQNYKISEVGLYDKIKRFSYFSLTSPNPVSATLNPFMYFLNEPSINKVFLTCKSDEIVSLDTTPPELNSLTVSSQTIDVGSKDRAFTISFTASDPESGLKNNTYPIVYLSTSNNRIIECISSIISIDNQKASYSCTLQIPFGFGYKDNIIISVYGFINNNGLFNGYSTNDLMDLKLNLGLDIVYNIRTSFTLNTVLLSHGLITEKGGDLWIFGQNLNGNSEAYITYSDGKTETKIPSLYYSTALLIKNVKATDKPYSVYIKKSSLDSNILEIKPTVYDFYIPLNKKDSSDTPTTPIPTNAPQTCLGNPVCGGPSHGTCVENKGCLCISPWFGKDCSSQIVIVDPPVIGGNNSGPSIEITVPDKNSTNPVTYSSLISIVALKETNINGETVKLYPFEDTWTSIETEPYTYDFYNKLNTTNNKNDIIVTNVKVTLKWFVNKTTVIFANEELTMNPSTLKYTIEILEYPFDSTLNGLELIMSAQFNSSTSDGVCSSKEFGETAGGDNSNYLKIKVKDYSLYGRFVRRGYVDSTVRSISNVLLDSSMKAITKPSSVQSYIGLRIPYYTKKVILDPDFSILLDQYSASSICANKSLSAGKIAGIVIGGFAFVIVVALCIIYNIKKKQKDKKMIEKINNKMTEMRENKL
ncbi:hypothetical protein DICPUDRAFT_149956 [Dictyostelium purpureum]|uniref:EGF-like domain-containing protein n=1 Tax=Dictyostelium purpureum TaxID=5786 RepID=F0ZF34_DICPU|nr:uncharacterized protein DICPUDRAFT_149956 [Dictyostelium purpureum]EGC37466.1 hypothetical protein DICPUDRAFT_149956 [Dictyostelium purpureum]|eukprot:XP_003286030.1 hypothetical protein DICPUDRAFT_149956 [Dictyostelium purpureum]